MKDGPPPDAATPAWAVALTDEFACEALANIAEMLRRVRASRDRMTEVLPLPPAEVGPVLASLRVPRAAAQEALNEGLRAGEVRLARSEDGVLVVATGGV